jgi:hypothetical protein
MRETMPVGVRHGAGDGLPAGGVGLAHGYSVFDRHPWSSHAFPKRRDPLQSARLDWTE